MTIGSVGSTSIQTLRNQLLQQLNTTGSGSQDLTGSASPMGDLLTLSPAAQQLAQAPAAVTQAMTDILEDYAGISATIIGIGVSRPENEGPWIAPLAGEPEPADVPTAVAGIPKHLALRIYSEGAQAVSAVLVKDGLMTPDQRATLRQLIVDEIAGTI